MQSSWDTHSFVVIHQQIFIEYLLYSGNCFDHDNNGQKRHETCLHGIYSSLEETKCKQKHIIQITVTAGINIMNKQYSK